MSKNRQKLDLLYMDIHNDLGHQKNCLSHRKKAIVEMKPNPCTNRIANKEFKEIKTTKTVNVDQTYKWSKRFTKSENAIFQEILKKKPNTRTRKEIEELDAFGLCFPYFAQFDETERYQLYRFGEGIAIDTNDFVYETGDEADAFYALAFGHLQVLVDFSKLPLSHPLDFRGLLEEHVIQMEQNQQSDSKSKKISSLYYVDELKEFDTFGEPGLEMNENIRTTSVQALEPSLVIKIDKDDFMDICSIHQELQQKKRTKFLQSLDIFKHMNEQDIDQISKSLKEITFAYDRPIVSQNSLAGDFYIIQHGECRILRSYDNLHLPHASSSSLIQFIETGQLKWKQHFGEFEVLYGHSKFQFTYLVSSPTCTLYKLPNHIFRVLCKQDKYFHSILKLTCNLNPENMSIHKIQQDLITNYQWEDYKSKLIKEKANKYYHKHTPHHQMNLVHELFDMTISSTLPKYPSYSSSSSISSSSSPRKKKIVKEQQQKEKQKEKKHWLQWVKDKVKDVDITSFDVPNEMQYSKRSHKQDENNKKKKLTANKLFETWLEDT